MLFLLCLLLPLAAANPLLSSSPAGYSLVIEKDILKSVKGSVKALPEDLDISAKEIRKIERNAFDEVSNIKSLNLAKNLLNRLPEFVFSNLTDLERLNLSNNTINDLTNLFVSLDKLKVLDISYNPVRYLRAGDLFGLPKSVDILVEGNGLTSISRFAFTSTFLKDVDEKERENVEQVTEKVKEETKGVAKRDTKTEEEGKSLDKETKEIIKSTENKIRFKICISDNIVNRLSILNENEKLEEGCKELQNVKTKVIDLRHFGIKGFNNGWYELQSIPIETIDLSNNEIIDITKELLNDLSPSVNYVILRDNKIKSVRKDAIENENLKALNLNSNPIEVFEEKALEKTKLKSLYLTDVALKDMSFVSSLPSTLEVLSLSGNEFNSIPNGIFSRLSKLKYLNLNNNGIKSVEKGSFEGLKSVEQLDFKDGQLEEIKKNAFEGLKNVQLITLHNNSIKSIENNAFSGLENLRVLFLSSNKISNINKDTFADFSSSFEELYLDNNQIESLENANFLQYPKVHLSLTDNKISNIPKGVLNLPYLRKLSLTNNNIELINSEAYDHLQGLQILLLNSNKINKIRKGDCRNFDRLYNLDLSNNPFERLENGALYGLRFSKGTNLAVEDNKIKVIQGGVFEDV